jgi:hypothetical protein
MNGKENKKKRLMLQVSCLISESENNEINMKTDDKHVMQKRAPV